MMAAFLVRRALQLIPSFLVISLVTFFIMQLPPSDIVTYYIQELEAQGGGYAEDAVHNIKRLYRLDRPWFVQYTAWVGGFLVGDFGYSLLMSADIRDLVAQRFVLSLIVSISALVFAYAVAVPIGIYSATHQYSLGDQIFTLLGFIGLATPNFLLALLIVYVASAHFGTSVSGLLSPEYLTADWDTARVADLLRHLWVPTVVVGTYSSAVIIRLVRERTLETLGQPFISVARSKGLPERTVLWKHAFRVVVNPLISMVGITLPTLISGDVIAAIVLDLPTLGPLLLRSLQAQDMYLAGTILLMMICLLLIGNLLADIALAIADPRIRY